MAMRHFLSGDSGNSAGGGGLGMFDPLGRFNAAQRAQIMGDIGDEELEGEYPESSGVVEDPLHENPLIPYLYVGEVPQLRENDVSYLDGHVKSDHWISGFLLLTNYRLMFCCPHEFEAPAVETVPLVVVSSYGPSQEPFLSLSRHSLYKVEKVGGQTTKAQHGYGILVTCKDSRQVRFSLNSENRTRGGLVKLLKTECLSPLETFPFTFRRREDGLILRRDHLVYDVEREYCLRQKVVQLSKQRLGELHQRFPHLLYKSSGSGGSPGSGGSSGDVSGMGGGGTGTGGGTGSEESLTQTWRISRMNEMYKVCESYPNLFCVPVDAHDTDVWNCAQARSRARIPFLCWADRSSGLSLTRSAQPRQGIVGGQSADDVRFIQLIVNSTPQENTLIIFDLRPRLNAEANRLRGGGYERGYKNTEIMYMSIENIHKMRASFERLTDLCQKSGGLSDSFYHDLQGTGWLGHCRMLLRSALFCCKTILKDRLPVLVHCSDGWDRTSQCVCLSQMCLDPYFRTIEGFAALVEKDWLAAGHMFQTRIATGMMNFLNDERSPIFLQFVECCHILLTQHPTAFEFNGEFLIFLMDEIYNARFGNFLFDSEKERREGGVYERTEDIWSFVLDHKFQFLNPFYDPLLKSTIIPDLRQSSIRFWDRYWLRYHRPKEMKGILGVDESTSTMWYHNVFDHPDRLREHRAQEMMKDLAHAVQTRHLMQAKNEKRNLDREAELSRLSKELFLLKKRCAQLEQQLAGRS